MDARNICLGLTVAVCTPAALAAGGISAPAAEVWPQWQARIAVQAASVSPLTLSGTFDGTVAQRSLAGGAMLGDFYFGNAVAGGFRASGGVLVGQQGGAPWTGALAGSHLSLAVNSGGATGLPAGADSLGTATYLGLGYTGAPARSSWALTADVGIAAGRLGAAAGVGRAILGNQGFENALRDMRLTPLLQLGVRYAF